MLGRGVKPGVALEKSEEILIQVGLVYSAVFGQSELDPTGLSLHSKGRGKLPEHLTSDLLSDGIRAIRIHSM